VKSAPTALLVLALSGCCCFPPHAHYHPPPFHYHHDHAPAPKPTNQAHPGGGPKPAAPTSSTAPAGALKKNFRCPECKATSETAMTCHGKPMVAVE
jgi:hypothetical protein